MNEDDRIAIVHVIAYVIEHLNEELTIRTGFSKEEYQNLIVKITNSGDQSFSNDEVIMIHQALNEVCNGILISDFEKEIGVPVIKIKEMLEILNQNMVD